MALLDVHGVSTVFLGLYIPLGVPLRTLHSATHPCGVRGASTDSVEAPRSPHGVGTECTWSPHGVHTEWAWSGHGVGMEWAWTAWSVHGVGMECTGSGHGV